MQAGKEWPVLVKIRVVAGGGADESAPAMNESPSAVETRTCELCPLTCVRAGVAVRIRQLRAAPELQARLREIGLIEDQIVRLVASHSSFICQVCNARLALSQQLAQLIMVEPVLPPARG